jgi:hypothetical protein
MLRVARGRVAVARVGGLARQVTKRPRGRRNPGASGTHRYRRGRADGHFADQIAS